MRKMHKQKRATELILAQLAKEITCTIRWIHCQNGNVDDLCAKKNHHETPNEHISFHLYECISIDEGSTKYTIEKLFIEASESA